jgi:hypothetical protein
MQKDDRVTFTNFVIGHLFPQNGFVLLGKRFGRERRVGHFSLLFGGCVYLSYTRFKSVSKIAVGTEVRAKSSAGLFRGLGVTEH